MDGRPVWLASVSMHEKSGLIAPAGAWPMAAMNKAQRVLKQILDGAGDRSRERLFRMNITVCLHRGLTDKEEAGLPEWWREACPVALAGGPVEIIKSRGTSGRASVKPCVNPTREQIDHRDSRLWIPLDCQSCPPCLDRIKVREEAIAQHASRNERAVPTR